MPKGYAIVTVAIHDQVGMDAYVQEALPTVLQSGGRPIVVQDNPEVIEGQWHGSRTVVLEFDSVEAVRAWYRSPEYQSVIGQRHAAADANAVFVGGFEMPSS